MSDSNDIKEASKNPSVRSPSAQRALIPFSPKQQSPKIVRQGLALAKKIHKESKLIVKTAKRVLNFGPQKAKKRQREPDEGEAEASASKRPKGVAKLRTLAKGLASADPQFSSNFYFGPLQAHVTLSRAGATPRDSPLATPLPKTPIPGEQVNAVQNFAVVEPRDAPFSGQLGESSNRIQEICENTQQKRSEQSDADLPAVAIQQGRLPDRVAADEGTSGRAALVSPPVIVEITETELEQQEFQDSPYRAVRRRMMQQLEERLAEKNPARK
ncbi:Oidioi.mRNA.OKI2018_I69.chr1.g2768.t1.cds [Oikopleura dioica]|uniref:Oidioi.mRNA.OKI2018_I69.chr1.g2768.t1.cds n=1 Tax=Oikopleura dioica TaxID=34765 RepID=A0ABN7SZ00_OIKDI|nr:Oidioi.mRNA.OKI2018_I69.chr1.g2768.t1.cds [Oikopleura dioica]